MLVIFLSLTTADLGMVASYEASSSVASHASYGPAAHRSEVMEKAGVPACPSVSASDKYDVATDDSWMVGDDFGTYELTYPVYILV